MERQIIRYILQMEDIFLYYYTTCKKILHDIKIYF